MIQSPGDRDWAIAGVGDVRRWAEEEVGRGAEDPVSLFASEEEHRAPALQIALASLARHRGRGLCLPVEQRGTDRVVAVHRCGREVGFGLLEVDEEGVDVEFWDVLDAFQRAAGEAGIPATDDFNRGDNEGAGYFDVNQRAGWRWNTAKAFLKPALGRKNLTVLTKAHVKRLIIEEGRVTGVEFHHDGVLKKMRARRETVLSAGAIGSPHILELSGVGRGDVLQAAGIDTVAEVQGVGENLQDHLQLRMVYKVSGVLTLNERASTLFGKARIGLEYALTRSGPMSMAPSQLGVFTRSSPEKETADLEYHVQPVSLDKFGDPVHTFPAITASVCNLRPESRGSVHVKGPDFAMQPEIRPNYLSTEGDRQVAIDAMRLTRRIVAQPAFARFKPEEYRPGPSFENDNDLAKAAGDIGTTIFHPVGTLRMGSDMESVVDARLKFRRLAGLRVADASVMPRITSGNTNSPTIMIAEKAADMILADNR